MARASNQPRTVDYTLVSTRLVTVTGPDPQDPSSERPESRYSWGSASGDLRGRLFSLLVIKWPARAVMPDTPLRKEAV